MAWIGAAIAGAVTIGTTLLSNRRAKKDRDAATALARFDAQPSLYYGGPPSNLYNEAGRGVPPPSSGNASVTGSVVAYVGLGVVAFIALFKWLR